MNPPGVSYIEREGAQLAYQGEQRGTVAVEESLETPLDRLVLSGVRRAPRFAPALVRTGQALERLRVG
jgi:hypothetical protein